jgi:alpha-L-fucosidase 2
MNATMDVAVCREVVSNLCRSYEILNLESEKLSVWRKLLDKLPKYEVNEDGAMREWLHPAFKDNYHHRHQSHIYPLFPGNEITAETDPELFEACRIAVEKRLVVGLTSQTGWSLAHMAHIYARLGLGDRALECLEILARSSTGPNLFTFHNDWRNMGLTLNWDTGFPPFQIDANFGHTSAIQEMLVYSNAEMVKLLPALPDKWADGSIGGIKCRCGITVTLKWDRPSATFSATLTADRATEFTLKLPDFVKSNNYRMDLDARQNEKFGAGYLDILLEKGQVVIIESC